MAIAIVQPNGVSAVLSQWSLSGGTPSKTAAVTDGSDLTFIYETTNNNAQQYTQPGPPAGTGKINSVAVVWRNRTTAQPSSSRALVYLAPTWTFATTRAHDVTGAWRTDTEINLPLPGGGAWTPLNFSQLEMGVQQISNSGGQQRVSRLEISLDYDLDDGGFALWVGSWLAPLLSVASHSLMKREIEQILSVQKNRPSTEGEYKRILEAFRVRPRFCFP